MSEIRRQTVDGLAWMGAARVAQQILQFAFSVALARLLAPADFGLIGLIVVFTGFVSVFVDIGLGAAVVQRKDLTERHVSSAFWLNVASGMTLTGIVAALSPAIAAFYAEPRLLVLTFVMSLNFIGSALGLVQKALLQRAMNFRRLAVTETAATVVAGGVAVACAANGFGVWSLVVLTLVTTCATSALLWVLSPWRPRLLVDRDATRELWRFGAGLLGFQTVNYWSRNADNLLVGRVMGPASLGIYGRAYNVMLAPITSVSLVTTRVMFPALSQIQSDAARVKRAYLRGVGMIALFTFPAAAGLFVASKPFVLTLYGPRWADMITVLQILCIPALMQSIGTTTSWIYQSQGRTDWMFRWGLASSVVTIASFAIGIFWGVIGVAAAYAVRTLLLTYFNYTIPGKFVGLTFLDVVRRVRGVFVAAVTMSAVVWLVGLQLQDALSAGKVLLIETGVGLAIYVGLVRAMSLAPLADVTEMVRERLGRQKLVGAAA